MKINIFTYVLLMILFSCCKRESKSAINNDYISNIEYIDYSEEKERLSYEDFLIFLDSTFQTKKETNFRLKIDTLRFDDFIKEKEGNLWYYLTKESDLFIRYGFINNNRRINLFTIHNLEPIQNNNCFEYIEGFAYNKTIDINKWPGLNYINNYVVKTNNNIYWLSSPCSVSYKNHLSLSHRLKSMLHEKSHIIIKDFFCKCGKPLCEK